MNSTAQRQRFRAILSGKECITPASVFDPLSARIAEDIGFEAGVLAGSTASMTVLGAPDLIVLSLTEFVEQARRICRASRLPLLVDADHGYGNALNVMRTVEDLETAGVAALTIEDTELPLPFGRHRTARLIPTEEGVGKMRAALAARQCSDLVIVARTSAPLITGLQDTIERCRRYERAGVDAVFVVGLKTRSELEALVSAVNVPIMLSRIEGELADLDHLARNNVRIALQGHHPIMASIQAIFETMTALRAGTRPEGLGRIASNHMVGRITRHAQYKTWIAEFLGTAKD